MRPKTLLVLALLALGMGAFIYFVERDLPTTEERAERAKKLLAVEGDEVTAIVIDSGEGTPAVRLERQVAATTDDEDDAEDDAEEAADGEDPFAGFGLDAGDDDAGDDGGDDEWRITAPFRARADRAAVASLLAALTGLEKERTLKDVDRAAASLEPPRHRVTLVTADGEERTIAVGGELPASSDVLVSLGGGDTAYQVAGGFVGDLAKEPGDWRDRSLFPGERGDVERLTLLGSDQHGPTHRILLARRGEGWWIEAPLTDRADGDAVDTLVGDLVALEASRFVDETPDAETGLEAPEDVVEVVLAGREQPFRVALGLPVAGTAGERWAEVDGQLVTVAGELVELLRRPASDWRSKSWTDTQVFRIDRAVVEDAAGSMELVRDDADWRRGDDKVSYTVVTDLLYELADAEAEEVVSREDAAARGLATDSPRLTLRLVAGDGALAGAEPEGEGNGEVLRLYPSVEGVAPATVEGRDVVLLLPAATADTIVGQVAALRDAEPLPRNDAAADDAAADDDADDDADDAAPDEGADAEG